MTITILDCLVDDLQTRQMTLRSDRNVYTYALKDLDPNDLMQRAYGAILAGLQRKGTLTEIITTIGKNVRRVHRLKGDNVTDAHIGWFICISFLEFGILSYTLQNTYKNGTRSKHPSYFFTVSDWPVIKFLWTLIDKDKMNGMYPMRTPAADWVKSIHENGSPIVKKMHHSIAKKITPEDQPIIFNNLNKLQKTPWRINRETFSAYQMAMQARTDAITKDSPFKFSKEEDKKKRESLITEAEAIEQIALSYLNDKFYHLYNYDFRSRLYVNTAYLHEQSSDNAKGILTFGDAVPLGEDGYYWLTVHTSNCWGNDKVKLEDRSTFVADNLEKFIGFARDPMLNREWMQADAPFSFLSCCYELKNIMLWVAEGKAINDFPSSLPGYIDGSTNGTQHLTAMSLDETVAHLVNLVPNELPGDLYMYIAGYVWEKLEVLANKLEPSVRAQFDDVFAEGRRLQRAYNNSPPKSEERALAFAAAKEWRNTNRDLRQKLFSVYWVAISNPKDQRKVCKRNVMTLGYGATKFGMGQQVIEDTRDMSEYLRDKEHLWGAMMGNLIYETCYEKLKGPAEMLTMFRKLAEISNSNNEYLQWTVPVTNFPVVQAYRKPILRRTKLLYGEDELKIHIESWEDATLDKDASEAGAAPNIVHSFDAAHLAMVVHQADYPVSVIHDSFGCHFGNMSKLFKLSRSTFYEFYKDDPLMKVLEELGSTELMPPRGNLDLKLIMESPYAFC